jgi:hypothetical protein
MRPFADFFRTFATPRGARLLFILLTLAGLLAFAASPDFKRRLGLNQHNLWFADSYAVLAASDAHLAGLDPTVVNPLDLLGRPHSYTDWWYALGRLGLTREHNFLVGTSWVLAFLAVTWLTLRPANIRSALFFALLALSPPVLLAINRANNDLVIFALLGLAVTLLVRLKTWGWLAALPLLALATGLKFYPVVGAALLLLVRPRRRLLTAALVFSVVLALVLHNVWPTLTRGQFALPSTLYTFGAPTLLRDLGYMGGGSRWIAAAFLFAAAIPLVRTGCTFGLADDSRDLGPRALFLLGSTVLLACFLAGVSYSYRWIFSLWLAPWLLQLADTRTHPARQQRCAVVTGYLLLGVSWLDGAFCLATNTLIGATSLDQLLRWQSVWRLLSQPLQWLLFALLAAWLTEAVLTTTRDLARTRTSPAPT